MTIRFRLTLLFTTLVALMIGLFGYGSYRYASFARAEAFDAELWKRAAVAATVALDSNEMTEHALAPFKLELLRSLHDECIAVYNAGCDTVYALGGVMSGITPAVFSATVRTGRTLAASADTQRVNLYYEDEGHDYVVSVSAIDREGRQSIARLGAALLVGGIVSVVLMFLTGWWFSGRAMAPIRGITRRAEEITATDLHVRIAESGTRDEVGRLAHAFNGMLNRLEAAFESQRQFIAHASHELRTPLTTLEGQLEVALMKLRTELEYEAVLRGALDDTRRLRDLANNLLLLARSDAHFQDAPFAPIRIDEIILAAVDVTYARYPRRSIDVNFAVEGDDEQLLVVHGNADLLRAVIVNALDNAMKYSPPGSPVKLALNATSAGIIIEIINGGEGIPEDEIDLVFDLFHRTPTFAHTEGSGIGLTLIRAIVERHNGHVSLQSRPGETTLRIQFIKNDG